MTDLAVTDALFFGRPGMDAARVESLVTESLAGMDDGELYLEYRQSEGLALDDGRLKSASVDPSQGCGVRAVADEAAG
jgi:TldD protein